MIQNKNTISSLRNKSGFTLLEILLVIAAIGILASIVIIAINPNRQLAQVRDTQRRFDLNTMYKAMYEYQIENGELPSGMTDYPNGAYIPVCQPSVSEIDCQNANGITLADDLVPLYTASLPQDPNASSATFTGYYVAYTVNQRPIAASFDAENVSSIAVGSTLEDSSLIIQDGLVLYWALDESTSGPVLDSSINNINGNWNGTPTPVTDTPSTIFENPYSLSFAGGTDFVINSQSDLDSYLPEGTEERTLSLWVKTDAVETGTVFGGYGSDSSNRNFQIGFNYANGGAELTFYGFSAGDYVTSVPSTEIADGQFHHIAITYDGSELSFYVNGTLRDTHTTTLSTVANYVCVAGEVNNATICDRNFDGEVDDFRIYNRVLSTDEIERIYLGNG
jgi:prepilin-type N-terminal cleavage/methylation domain-containing protein